MSMNKRYDIQINCFNELRENYFNLKQNEASIIEPINYPISLSEIRTQLINWLIFLVLKELYYFLK